jgi:hypothetical protein
MEFGIKINHCYARDCYYAFLILKDNNHVYHCVSCGFQPPILIADGCHKVRFDLTEGQVDWTGCDGTGINRDAALEKIMLSVLYRGSAGKTCGESIQAKQWPPFIGPKTSLESLVNTEFKKGSISSSSTDIVNAGIRPVQELTAEQYHDLMQSATVEQLKKVISTLI